MTEATKLAHLWRGLKPSVVEKLWSLKPTTCDELLREVKRYQEITFRSRQAEWTLVVVAKQALSKEGDNRQTDWNK